jgi:hypothetical protein
MAASAQHLHRHRLLGAVGAAVVSVSTIGQPVAQVGFALDEVTVLTMAPDGAWGVATDASASRAFASAIARCRRMSRSELGCGAQFTAIRGGWSLGIRCGTENIIVAARELADAERAAINREIDLKYRYAPDMPPCRRVLSVNPDGEIVDLLPGTAGGMSAR